MRRRVRPRGGREFGRHGFREARVRNAEWTVDRDEPQLPHVCQVLQTIQIPGRAPAPIAAAYPRLDCSPHSIFPQLVRLLIERRAALRDQSFPRLQDRVFRNRAVTLAGVPATGLFAERIDRSRLAAGSCPYALHRFGWNAWPVSSVCCSNSASTSAREKSPRRSERTLTLKALPPMSGGSPVPGSMRQSRRLRPPRKRMLAGKLPGRRA